MEKMVEMLLQYGGFGLIFVIYVIESRRSNRRFEQQYKKLEELVENNTQAFVRLNENMKYNAMCPVFKRMNNSGVEIWKQH